MADRRFERRVSKDEEVEIVWRDPASGEVHLTARLHDLSRSGACLIVERPIRMGISIAMRWGGRELSGRVRYCKRKYHQFSIGVEFEDTTV